ncbi:MAG: FtsH protease activity modulator HflK [Proteobacteria bacterium]|nr:FtsH protease activity modulator HflK [Pseudomonadota bacterium]
MSQHGDDQILKEIDNLLKKIGWKRGPHQMKRRKAGGQGFQPDKSGFRLIMLSVLGLAVLFTLLQSFYMVDVSEDGVVTRFGRYVKTVGPGLHMKLPFNIEAVERVKTKIVHQEEFGFRTTNARGKSRLYSNETLKAESLMLTGDLNVADVEWILQYRITDPWKYLFKARDVETNIRDVSISIMRRVVGDRLVNDVLTTGRVAIADEAKLLTQQVLDHYDMGIVVARINLQDVNPPDPVKGAFNEVNAAKQEQEQTINRAEQEYNRQIPEARGRAEQTIKDAEAFSINLVNRSLGDADKFNKILVEYAKAPDITKKRLYLETMRAVLKDHQNVTVIDKALEGILPIYGSYGPAALSQGTISQSKEKLDSE